MKMGKLLSLLWITLYCLFFLISLIAYLPLSLVKLLVSKESYVRLFYILVSWWGRATVRSTGSRVYIEGLDLIPDNGRLCFIGNHQGLFDIPALLGYLGRPVAFIAKKELFRVPILSLWMREFNCVFIDRKNSRAAIKSFEASAKIIRSGHPLIIFPEGTRSQKDEMGEFHQGSFKLPLMAEATIVPFVIKGTWRIYEGDRQIRSAPVKIRILPAIEVSDPIYSDRKRLSEYLYSLIESNLKSM
jgi:1-acyl-sn-glycerol-3-phosphate acyltransferase